MPSTAPRHLRALGHERLAGLVADHLTTGPAGEVVTFEERLAEVERRYGAEHIVARSVRQAKPKVQRCIEFLEGRLQEVAAP